MKKTALAPLIVPVLSAALTLALVFPALALEKEELKDTYRQMSWDDVLEIQEQVGQLALGSAVETGFVKGSAWGGSGGYYLLRPTNINKNKPAELDNISLISGGGGGFVVNLDKSWAVGVNFLGMGGSSSKKIGVSYSYYNVGAFMALPYVMFRPVVLPNFIIDASLGAGWLAGGYDIYNTNELGVQTEISRSGNTWPVSFEIDARYRIMPVWHVGLKGGYLLANISELKRADFVDTSVQSLDFSGLYFALTMGGNF